MKSERGITLVSIAMYVIVVIIVTGILAVITTTYGQNILKMNKEGTSNVETDKFGLYFLREVKTEGNEISSISEENNEITFTTGNKYTFKQDSNNIYLNDNIEIASNIEKCTFESKLENGKTIITVTIKAEDTEEKSTEYVLANQEIASSYENELNYVHERPIQIGDYVEYTPTQATYSADKLGADYTGSTSNTGLTTETKLKWRVLEADANGCLTIISDKPTSTKVYFNGSKGYNNGVYILNDICKTLYSSTDLGVSARSLTIEDVEAGFTDTEINKRNEYTYSGVKYNQTKTYTKNITYPVIYAKETGSGIGVTENKATTDIETNGINKSEAYYNESQLITKLEGDEKLKAGSSGSQEKALTCTQTGYSVSRNYTTFPELDYKHRTFFRMILENGATWYWLASRAVNCGGSYARFGFFGVGNYNISVNEIFASDGSRISGGPYVHLRPVIPLGPDVKVTKCTGENSDKNPHTLSKATS